MKDQNLGPGSAGNQDAAKGENLNQKLKFSKISQMGDVLSKQL